MHEAIYWVVIAYAIGWALTKTFELDWPSKK